tara:strand:- start:134328 stop:134645 length:318 start_codon:yes stop_codon:yes gene_type:complete
MMNLDVFARGKSQSLRKKLNSLDSKLYSLEREARILEIELQGVYIFDKKLTSVGKTIDYCNDKILEFNRSNNDYRKIVINDLSYCVTELEKELKSIKNKSKRKIN